MQFAERIQKSVEIWFAEAIMGSTVEFRDKT